MKGHSIIIGSIVFLLLFSQLPVFAENEQSSVPNPAPQTNTSELNGDSESFHAIASEVVPEDIHSEKMLDRKISQIQQEIKALRDEKMALIKEKMQLIQAQSKLKWRDAEGGKIPNNSVICAYSNNNPLYICRASVKQTSLPGQLTAQGCSITYNDKVHVAKKYQVLSGPGALEWKPPKAISQIRRTVQYYRLNPEKMTPNMDMSKPASLPVRASDQFQQPIYICRGIFENRIALGRVQDRFCHISWDGQVMKLPTYEVLFAKRQ